MYAHIAMYASDGRAFGRVLARGVSGRVPVAVQPVGFDGGEALGGPGERHVQGAYPGTRIGPDLAGATSTTPSYSMPLASRLVTTCRRAAPPVGQPAGDLVAARAPA